MRAMLLLPRFLPAAVVAATFVACSPDGTSPPATAPASQTRPDSAALHRAAQQFRVHYNSPVNLDSTSFYYVPVSVVPQEKADRSRVLSSSFDSYDEQSDGIEGTCYNVLFFQKETGQQHALLPHGRFTVQEIDAAPEPGARWPYVFYRIIKADTNHDGSQDTDDASALFVSDRSGRHVRQLTPDDAQLGNRLILPKTSLLLVQVRPDTNHDGQFTHADGPYWLRFNLRDLRTPPVRQPDPALTEAMQQQMLLRQSRVK
ncbi:hypothetical protein KLP40_13970 [Hymenobacter sp. NST-14]|uniref:hypothetical protein n=1 Tax=Hymenobacter piscis TaxID=2839984 RepID=UPI001C01574D|nr:hypothetical protein [Hymenobacter piscis]MBT9394274.1 hypothetical protein [Hymenobacter piscis]